MVVPVQAENGKCRQECCITRRLTALPNSSPMERYDTRTTPHHVKQKKCRDFSTAVNGGSKFAMPRVISRISICTFNLVFEPHVYTNKRKAASLKHFSDMFYRCFSFSRLVRQVLSLLFILVGSFYRSHLRAKRNKTGYPLVRLAHHQTPREKTWQNLSTPLATSWHDLLDRMLPGGRFLFAFTRSSRQRLYSRNGSNI